MNPLGHINPQSPSVQKIYPIALTLLAFAFFLRVLGQFLVAFFNAPFLPPMPHWYSGLLPYPVLLPIQLLILFIQFLICRDIWRRRGRFSTARPSISTFLRWFSYIYFTSMILRYILTMVRHPDRRWLTGTIPIFFHLVLAAWLFILSRYYARMHRP